MPRKRERIGDELLLANGVWELDPSLPLSPRQVALITGLGLGQLKERRRTRPPQPPFPFRRDDGKPGTAVWYPLGEALNYKRERMPRTLPTLVSRTSPPLTFSAFLAQALPDDEWPFQRTSEGLLIDFFASLRLGLLSDQTGDGVCAWLSLSSYLDAMKTWVADQQAKAMARSLSATLTQDGGTPKRRPRTSL